MAADLPTQGKASSRGPSRARQNRRRSATPGLFAASRLGRRAVGRSCALVRARAARHAGSARWAAGSTAAADGGAGPRVSPGDGGGAASSCATTIPRAIRAAHRPDASPLSAPWAVGDAADLLLTRGSQMALYLIAQALLRPGDVVAVEALGYPQPGPRCDKRELSWCRSRWTRRASMSLRFLDWPPRGDCARSSDAASPVPDHRDA